MTTSIAHEQQRRRGGRPRSAQSIDDLAVLIALRHLSAYEFEHPSWPSSTWRADPVGFFREVLGVEPWSKQIEVIEAVRDHKRVAVRSGHKVSKSHTAAGVAWWFFSSFDDARVIMTSTTARQVDQILWREAKMMHARSGVCVACKAEGARTGRPGPRPCPHSRLLDQHPNGHLPELARTGLHTRDFRELVGFTARESEAVAGISGKNLLYIVDEASGVPEIIFEAIEGNRAGGGRVLLLGNPTRNEGEHYEAFEGTKRDAYHPITISSEDTPNAVTGEDVIPGLATREWIEERKREWGPDSALYMIRVKGKHALQEEGAVNSVHAIKEAEERWPDTAAEGRLYIGLDPAGPGLFGDETAWAPRRGNKVLSITARAGMSEDAIVAAMAGLVRELAPDVRKEPALPMIVVDKGGKVGSIVYGALVLYAAKHPLSFVVVGVDASAKAEREPLLYEIVRDELWARGAIWLREGGAIPPDVKLAKDLHSAQWEGRTGSNRTRVTPKEVLKKKLGRSPDRGDAVNLAVWEPVDLEARVEEQLRARAESQKAVPRRTGAVNAYDWERAFRGDR